MGESVNERGSTINSWFSHDKHVHFMHSFPTHLKHTVFSFLHNLYIVFFKNIEI